MKREGGTVSAHVRPNIKIPRMTAGSEEAAPANAAIQEGAPLKEASKRTKAKEEIERLLQFALDWAAVDPERSEKALEIALKIWKKHNLRNYPIFKRYFYCHNCKQVLVPGRSARVRIRPGKVMRIVVNCSKCGANYRIPLAKFKRRSEKSGSRINESGSKPS